MEVEGNLEEDEEDRHQFAGSGERSAEAVASVGEDGAGEVNSVLETPALTLRLLNTSHLTPYTSHLTPHTSHLTPYTSHLTPHTSQRPLLC